MSEDLYAKPDLTKKVRFQKSKKDKNEDVADNDSRIYDNYCPKEGPSAKPQEDTIDQQQTSSVSVDSGDRNLLRAVVAFVVLLCLILLVSLTVLLVLWIEDRTDWRMDVAKLSSERDELWTNFSKIQNINQNLTEETSMLQEEKELLMTQNRNLTAENEQLHNLTEETSVLQEEKELLMTKNRNLAAENERLHNMIEATRCPSSWIKFDNSCYLISDTLKNWNDGRNMCKGHGADLVIISNIMEQAFITSLRQWVWIGLTDEEEEGSWKWVNGEAVTTTYWNEGEPNNGAGGEDCVVIRNIFPKINNWNDLSCGQSIKFVCERTLP
ncbi:uncharacterized protein V6R79_013699 [Siganus canaliculatus]